MTLRVRLVAPTGEAVREVRVSRFPARIGRDPAAEVAVGDHEFPVVSGLHAEIDRTAGGFVLAARSPKNRTLHNDRPVDGPVELRPGDRVRLGVTGPTLLVVAIEPADEAPPVSDGPRRTVRRRRGRSAALLAAGLVLHLVGVVLALILIGVLPNPLTRGR